MINDLKVQRKATQDEIKRKRVEQPKQYAQGWTEFYKLKFKLTEDVLIPRPETELLVDEVNVIASAARQSLTVLDIGTGSGCIAISVAKNIPGAHVIAVDVSPQALEVAKINAKFHKVEDRVFFLESDLLSFVVQDKSKAPDVIVTNLPYIPTSRLMMIDPMVSEWEPKVALDGGLDGFDLYRKLFSQIKEKNFYPKYLIAEIDHTHGEIALAEAKKYFPDSEVQVKKDLAGKERILTIKSIRVSYN